MFRVTFFRRRLAATSASAAAGQTRLQSTTSQRPESDKKFHCSVCFKAFRLSTAAQVHLAQAHGGNGTVNNGPGPGPAAAPPSAAAAATSQMPRAGGGPRPGSDGALGGRDDEEEYRPIRRQRPTPQPLNKSILEMPPGAMEAMMDVWDTIGAKRLAADFLPSSAVSKVFAARPNDGAAAPTYQAVVGDDAGAEPNPFEEAAAAQDADHQQKASSAETKATSETAPTPLAAVSPTPTAKAAVPFAASGTESVSPFRPGAVRSPFLTAAAQVLPGPKPRGAKPADAAAAAGEAEGASPPSPDLPPPGILGAATAATASQSPFAAAAAAASASAAAAGQAVSPFAAMAGTPNVGTGQAPSPFAAAGAAPSPFAAAAAPTASPFAPAATPAAAVGAPPTVASPFAAAAAGGSATDAAASATPFTTGGFSPMGALSPMGGPLMDAANTKPLALPCPQCDRTFTSQRALSDHAKAKHDLSLPRGDRGKRNGPAMELPPYVPSPVDVETAPYGSVSSDVRSKWAEVELFPHASMVNNMQLLGEVVTSEQGKLSVTGASGEEVPVQQLVVAVDGENGDEEIVVRVFGEQRTVAETFDVGTTVLASGCLRLNPTHDATSNRYYCSPALHVALPCGTIHAVA